MALIDVVKYDGPQNVLAWKYPTQELGTWTQLVVNESQEALLFKGGKALDLFLSGTHTLETKNIPILNNIINLPFGGRSPFTAEVWYINKLHILDIKWGTSDPLQLQDPQYKIIIPVRSFGQFGVQVEDSRKFLVNLVGTLPNFEKNILVEYFRGLLITKIKDLISSYLVHNKVSILEINAYIDEISKHIQEQVTPAFENYGIKIVNFFVNSINFPEDDSAVVKLKDALAKKAEMDIVGFNYQQERSFDTMEAAANNEGGNAGLMNAGIGLGLGVGIGAPMGNVMGKIAEQIDTQSPVQNEITKCQKCGTVVEEGNKFCSNCGSKFIKETNASGGCKCTECNCDVPAESKFCPNCGTPMVRKCSNCGNELKQGDKFCSKCGTKF